MRLNLIKINFLKNKKNWKKGIDKSVRIVYNEKVLKRIVMTMASDFLEIS